MNKELERIEIVVGVKRNAIQTDGPNAGTRFIIDEIELGMGPQRKAMKYDAGFIKPDTECKAVITSPGHVRIVG